MVGIKMTRKDISDSVKGQDSVSIEAFQSGMLVLFTRKLAVLTKDFKNKPECECLATATIVMGAAALEALFLEVAYKKDRELYKDENFRKRAGVPKKYEILTNQTLEETFPDVLKLWESRLALSHSEPDLPRTRFVGEKINPEGAIWVADTLDKFATQIWGDQMPKWFTETTGLLPLI